MKKIFLLMLLVSLSGYACSDKSFVYPLKGSAILKDKKTVYYDVSLHFETKAGLDEMTVNVDKIKHALRIISAQRASTHLDNPGRLISILNKVFKSQLKHGVIKVQVNDFKVE